MTSQKGGLPPDDMEDGVCGESSGWLQHLAPLGSIPPKNIWAQKQKKHWRYMVLSLFV